MRSDYQNQVESLVVSIYEEENFEIDQFEILSLKKDIILDVNSNQNDIKLKFSNSLRDLLNIYQNLNNKGKLKYISFK